MTPATLTATPAALPAAGLWRRLAALLYDALLMLALAMIATACFLPFTNGEAVTWARSPALFVAHKLVLVGIVVGFYGLSWTRAGHTLGMTSWRLRVERDATHAQAATDVSGRSALDWADTLRRLGFALLSWAPLGLGWLWCLVDARRRTWHDILSRTRVVVVPKGARNGDQA